MKYCMNCGTQNEDGATAAKHSQLRSQTLSLRIFRIRMTGNGISRKNGIKNPTIRQDEKWVLGSAVWSSLS